MSTRDARHQTDKNKHTMNIRWLRAPMLITILAGLASVAVGVTGAVAAPGFKQYVPTAHFGWNVDATKTNAGAPQAERDVCTIASGDECVSGSESGEPGGFRYPEGAAIASNGGVYVADANNHRIEVLEPDGAFASVFGWNVNKTKVEAGAPQEERDVCTAGSNDVCQAGEEGTGLAEQLGSGEGLAIDPSTGNLYVYDGVYHRVDEYTPSGQLVLMIGEKVNKTKTDQGAVEAERNLCTATSKDVCQAGTPGTPGAKAHGGFSEVRPGRGNTLYVGGSEDLLYVAEPGRVQEFATSGATAGQWKTEVSLAELSQQLAPNAITVDPSGDVFVAYEEEETKPQLDVYGVREFNPSGQLQSIVFDSTIDSFYGLAWDPHGWLAVLENVLSVNGHPLEHGALYNPANAEKVSEFNPVGGAVEFIYAKALAFDPAGENLYTVYTAAHEVEAYHVVIFPEATSCPAQRVTATTAVMCGRVNPNGVLTTGFFEYGPPAGTRTATAFEGQDTSFQNVEWELTSLIPNQDYQYQFIFEAEAEGKHQKAAGAPVEQFHTTSVAPVIEGSPSASFVTAQSAVLEASLNPEHAATSYHFQYLPCSGSPVLQWGSAASTADQQASIYGALDVAQEAAGLRPQTTYCYRLVADNEHEEGKVMEGGTAIGPEGTFTTVAAATPQATTGAASAIDTTSAVISGMVNPDGQQATYAFELGVYEGTATRYGVVVSGSAGAGTGFTPVSYQLSGLQPGTTYAYRVKVYSGYGDATGASLTFTTGGVPSVIGVPGVPAQLAVPGISFPPPEVPVTPGKLTRAQKLARALRACKREPKHRQASCRRRARRKYGPIHKKKGG